MGRNSGNGSEAERQARLAAALRTNLARRKARVSELVSASPDDALEPMPSPTAPGGETER